MPLQPNSPAARDAASVLHPYSNLKVLEEVGPLIAVRGKGVYIYDDAGKEYIEGMAGLWCTALGFGEEALVEAAIRQMRQLPYYHTFAHKSSLPLADLAEKLKAIAPAPFSKVLFVNSGSEANDSLIKIIWYYNNAIGRPKKKKFISRIKAYHGVTVATASLTGLPNNHRDFDVPLPGFLHAECPHHYRGAEPGESEAAYAGRLAASLEDMILREDPDTVAAFIAEPIMGAGGVILPPATYFEKIQPVLKKYDIFFIDDEVICGFGRTGRRWGAETYGIKPDFLSCAKQLSSAYLPIAAAMIPEKVYEVVRAQSNKIGTFGHGFTYGGHPVPAAVAIRTLELYEERDILGHVNRVSPRFLARLKKLADHPLVGDCNGIGLIGGIELVADKKTKRNFEPSKLVGLHCTGRAQEHGLVHRAIGDRLAFCPPLIITEAEIDRMFDACEKALDDTEAWVRAEGLRAVS
jgi:4-aminobutyrate--pyruvate transaminase